MARSALLISLTCCCGLAFGQRVIVRSGFLHDSVAVGEPTPYFLSSRSPAGLQVLHPDSTHSFEPFEFVRRKSYPTVTHDGRSFDSTVYWIRTFELDSVQSLSLPALVLEGGDTVSYAATSDGIGVRHIVREPPDPSVPPNQLELKSNTLYERVRMFFNYSLFLIVSGSLIAVSGLLVLVFRRRIIRAIRRWKLSRDYRRFTELFDERIERIRSNPNAGDIERALLCWKQYMERLEEKPFLKFTTKEIREATGDGQLAGWLQQIDRSLYGGASLSAEAFEPLGLFAQSAHRRRQEELRHE